ncbi:MAG TPA: ABC transporter transmembrane domain-containing protein, partial [bacterium]|nr:ABC transporter transmembrane domain-containing protein [bacterium]
MKPELLRALTEAGTPIVADASHPFAIHDPAQAWLVADGRVDVFFTALRDGVPEGQRRYVFTITAGQLVFGLPALVPGRDHGLVAVGLPETSVVRFPLDTCRAVLARAGRTDDLVYAIEEWVCALTNGIAPPYTPRDFVGLTFSGTVTAERRVFIRPTDRLLWIRHTAGGSSYLSNANLYLSPADAFIPLIRGSWLETAEEQNTLETQTTGEYLARPDEVWHSVAVFTAMVLECLKLAALETGEQEAAKEQERRERDARALHAAVHDLATVLDPLLCGGAPVADGMDTDPLYAACKLVGAAEGMTIRPAPASTATVRGRDPLDDIIRASRVRHRQVMLRDDWWRRECSALLVFRDGDHAPLAALPNGRGGYWLADPAAGTRQTVNKALAATLQPQAWTLYRALPARVLGLKDILLFSLKGCARDLLLMVGMGLLGGWLGMLLPIATGMVMDDIIPNAARPQLWQMFTGLVVFALAGMLFQVARGFAQLRLETRMDNSVQAAVWDRLLDLPVPFFRQYSVGDLAQRAGGINQIRMLLAGATASTLLSSVFSCFSFFLLFYYSVPLALMASGLVFISVTVTTTVSVFNLRFQKRILEISGRLSGHVLQFITGISKLRVAGAEARAFAFWARDFARQRRLTVTMETITNAFQVFNASFATVCQLVIYSFLAWQIMQAQADPTAAAALTTGDFIAFSAAFGQFMAAMTQFGSVLVTMLQVVPLYERARSILTTPPEVVTGKAEPGELRGEIEVSSVCFRYSDNGPDVLKNVTLQAKPGEFIGIVGASGSGKSTL